MPGFAVKQTKQRVLALIGVAALSLTMAAPALAEDDLVVTSITPGLLTMVVAAGPMTAAYDAGTATGAIVLNVDDARTLPTGWATSDGWYVTMEVADDFEGTVDDTATIDASTLKATSIALTASVGQSGADGPVDANDNTGLGNGPAMVLSADEGKGNGAYVAEIATSLVIPDSTRPDVYTSTLTSTLVASAPV